MTPFHILVCSSNGQGVEIYKYMIVGDCPLTYALYAEAPIEVINYLFKTHRQMWGTLLFDFAHMLQRLAKYAYLD